jgi:hypothetical protein
MGQRGNRSVVQRVGTTPEAHAQWLVDLAYRHDAVAHLASLSPADVQDIWEEMEAFLPDDPARPDPNGPSYPREQYALHWLSRIRHGVRQLNKGRAWGHHLVTHYSFWVPLPGQSSGHNTPLHLLDVPHPPDKLEVTRRPKDAMAHKICATLASMGARLRRCSRKGCHRLFVAHKRQCYCTPACSSVTRTRKHRTKQRNSEVLQQDARMTSSECILSSTVTTL